jgi:hypothetical protein
MQYPPDPYVAIHANRPPIPTHTPEHEFMAIVTYSQLITIIGPNGPFTYTLNNIKVDGTANSIDECKILIDQITYELSTMSPAIHKVKATIKNMKTKGRTIKTVSLG